MFLDYSILSVLINSKEVTTMTVESTKIGDAPVLILWFDTVEEALPLTRELRLALDDIEKSTFQVPSRKVIFGIDVFQRLSIENADQTSELKNCYYCGQVGPGRAIVFHKL